MTADPDIRGGQLEKDAFIFRALAPAAAQEQDERMRQIFREELAATKSHPSSQQPPIKVKNKHASLEAPFGLALIGGFSDELQKIKSAQMTMSSVAPKPTVSSQVTARVPRNTLSAKTPSYSQVNPASTPGPTQAHQPTLSPPPVRG